MKANLSQYIYPGEFYKCRHKVLLVLRCHGEQPITFGVAAKLESKDKRIELQEVGRRLESAC